MAFPRFVQIGPICYSVEADGDRIRRERAVSSPYLTTTSDYRQSTIVVDPALHPRNKAFLLLVQVLRETIRVIGDSREKKTQEQWVERLSPALLDLLQRNPDLVAYLTRPEEPC